LLIDAIKIDEKYRQDELSKVSWEARQQAHELMKDDAHIYNPAIYEKYDKAVMEAKKATKAAIEAEKQICYVMVDLLADAKNRGHNIVALHYTSKKWDDMIAKKFVSNSGPKTYETASNSSPPSAGSKCQ
jgi:hypothetical protein